MDNLENCPWCDAVCHHRVVSKDNVRVTLRYRSNWVSQCLRQFQNKKKLYYHTKECILWANDISHTHFEMFPVHSRRGSWIADPSPRTGGSCLQCIGTEFITNYDKIVMIYNTKPISMYNIMHLCHAIIQSVLNVCRVSTLTLQPILQK